jgi:hypothetical protein
MSKYSARVVVASSYSWPLSALQSLYGPYVPLSKEPL